MLANILGNAISHGDQPIIVEAMVAFGHLKLSIANGGGPISGRHGAAVPALHRGDVSFTMRGLGF